MADGSTKPIEKVKAGNKVIATDPKTGEKRVETVTAEIKGQGLKHLVKITVDTDGKKGTKTAQITATDGHPFWVPELGEWIDATDLKVGQWLQTSAGTYVQITAIQRWTSPGSTVHNLTVGNLHTYYVLAATTPVLTHNTSGQACEVWTSQQTHLTSGVLDIQVDQIPLGSGENAGGFLGRDNNAALGVNEVVDWRSIPGMTKENYHHVEMQAAAYMRLNNIRLGRLYINYKSGACGYCDGRWYHGGVNIEDALPHGAQLWVTVAGGRTVRYVGNRS